MRYLLFGGLVSVIGCSASDSDYPPPPPEAVARCVIDQIRGTEMTQTATTTLWYDAYDRLIRVDGYYVPQGDAGPSEPGTYYLAWDDQGRLVESVGPQFERRYSYASDQVEETGSFGTTISRVVDGRITHSEGPLENAFEDRRIVDFEYDAAGNLTSSVGVSGRVDFGSYSWANHFTYDAQGRVTTAQKKDQLPVTFAYTDASDRIEISVSGDWTARLTYEFDAAGRIIATSTDQLDDGVDIELASFTYGDHKVEQLWPSKGLRTVASGRCDHPTTQLAPEPPLPIRGYASLAAWWNTPIDYATFSLFYPY